MDKKSFEEDVRTQSAVLHQLLIIGEATKRLTATFRKAHPDVPWSLMAGMRDRLIHRYNEVDLHEVWATVERDIPALLDQVEEMVPDDPRSS